jgi:threonine dehydratase
VALAARILGLRATVFMPAAAPIPKVTATRSYGAEVELAGESVDRALLAAEEFAARTGAVMIHPFDNEDVVSGQATVGLEILEQCPDVATVLVCTGGGGLLAGIATVMADRRPEVTVIGVQAAAAAAYPPSLRAGHPLPLPGMATMADGIAVGRPGDVPFGMINRLGVPIRTVTEEGISRALVASLERSKLLVEPAGAVGLALLLERPEGLRPPVVVVLSGGNVDPTLLVRVLNHGLVAAGRYLSLRIRMADHPGALAAVLSRLAPLGANVVGIEHLRTRDSLAVGEVDVDVNLQTRGPDHCREIIAAMRDAGLRLQEM